MFKDTLITSHQKKRELAIILLCIGAAFIFNLVGIIKFATPAKELFTQLHIVLLVAVFFYVVVGICRLLWLLVRSLFLKKKAA